MARPRVDEREVVELETGTLELGAPEIGRGSLDHKAVEVDGEDGGGVEVGPRAALQKRPQEEESDHQDDRDRRRDREQDEEKPLHERKSRLGGAETSSHG